MTDKTELPAVATNSAPATPVSDDTGIFGAVDRQSQALLKAQEQAMRFAFDRTQSWIDFGGVWMDGCAKLSRDSVDATRNSLEVAAEDSARMFRLWTDIGFQALAPLTAAQTRAN
jgi:hypothetical protein